MVTWMVVVKASTPRRPSPFVAPIPATVTTVEEETSYEDDIQNILDEANATIDDDPTVYVKLFYTTDFDATSR